jgi:hypothetical protein
MRVDPDDLERMPVQNLAKEEEFVQNLDITQMLDDDNITERRKEDLLLRMGDMVLDDYTDDQYFDQDEDIEEYECELKLEDHQSQLLCGRFLSKLNVKQEQ